MSKKVKSGGGMGAGAWLAIVAVVLVLGGGLYLSITDKPPGEKLPSQGNAHLKTVDEPHPPYNSNPPTSGPHTNARQWFDIHEEFQPNELQVHNLEDGGVIIHYHPEKAKKEDIEALKAMLVKRFPGRNPSFPRDRLDHILMHPNPTIDTAWALTAWTRLDKFDAYDEKRIVRFIQAYKGIDHHVK